ncbi:MAG: hypothetical protein JJV95_01120 [Sulfurospirillum sp.]|nr:hypothetical protein [Sulfurospirillum sp.]
MKDIIMLVVLLLVFSGCVAEKTYATGKVIYKGGKTVHEIETRLNTKKLDNE